MTNNGYSKDAIQFVDKSLIYLSQHTNLKNPEEVKAYIASLKSGNGYKRNLVWAYNKYCELHKIYWERPIYKAQSKIMRIPTTAELDSLISSAGFINSIKLAISKETGLRPKELSDLKVKDIDIERRTIHPITAKHGAPRKLKISNSLTANIETHIQKYKLNTDDKIFVTDSVGYAKQYRHHRNRLAKRLNRPELKTIRLYDFRHYYATRLYAKTKDILLVKQQLGHKRIENTLIYTQLTAFNEEEEYTCKATNDKEEEMKLIENGFQYVKDTNGYSLYRKRK
ncbi:MAG: tyrosine-type recombinase/integrase [Candidatus Bathyarchaeota archaeon]|nr:tyrosine-type recombinase/integrase [Candidatus Bathyarchaeota archaeon]